MQTKQAVFLLLFTILVGSCFTSVVTSQDPTPTDAATPTPSPTPEPTNQALTVQLTDPANKTTITSTFNYTYRYLPIINGTNDYYLIAKLYINGTERASTNQTAIVNNTQNTLTYQVAGNGTYFWNVMVYNSTHGVKATENFTITFAVHEEPEPTATPSPTPAPTASPTPVPTATATITPSPTPPPNDSMATWTIIIAVVVIAGIAAVALLSFRHKAH
ncbi:MAG: hypothetical protein NWE92_11245 [Candidatus Bathyarchaeota archaeon]|nr:hypothetical protein [Candidatus Bathyarchaeota archaeon]